MRVILGRRLNRVWEPHKAPFMLESRQFYLIKLMRKKMTLKKCSEASRENYSSTKVCQLLKERLSSPLGS